MSDFTKHLILYSAENQAIATQLSNMFRQVGQEATPLKRTNEDYAEQVGQVKVPDDSSVILLMTDNFLKSYGCMNGILQAAHKWGESSQLSIIVADGIEKDEVDQAIAVPTKFERVGEIIQYMNFWQDLYLEMRKEKRKRKNDEELEEKLLITKEISGEVGEFLRYVRGYGFDDLEAFKEKKAALTEEAIPEGASILPSPATEDDMAPPLPDEKSLVEMIEDSSEELIAENPQLNLTSATGTDAYQGEDDVDDEDTLTDEILSAIPGLDLLDKNDDPDSHSIFNEILKDDESIEGTTPGRESDVIPNGHFSEKEMEKLDDENAELMSILDEVLIDEDLNVADEKEEYNFVGEDPDNPDDFNIESLFEEEDHLSSPQVGAASEQLTQADENEVLLNFVEEGTPEEELLGSDEILEKAVTHFRENRNEEGIAVLAKALTANPTDTSLRYYHAYALARYATKYKEAEQELNTLLEQDDAHPDGWFLLAELSESQEDFARAKMCFEQVIDVNPHFPEAQYRLGLLLSEQFPGEEAKAAQHLQLAIDQNEKNVDAMYLLAILLNEHLKQPEAAVKYFRQALNLQPRHPFANYDLALVYHGLNDLERAAEFYEKAVVINPELKTPQNDEAFKMPAKNQATTKEPSASEPVSEAKGMKEETPESLVFGNKATEDDQALEVLEKSDAPLQAVADETPAEEATIEQPAIKVANPSGDQTTETIVHIADENAPITKSKIVLVTGATAGIGRATAEIFARNGYQLIITGRRAERLHDLKDEFATKYNTKCLTLSFDVRDPHSVKEAIDNLSEEWSDIDILINNAGLSRGLDPVHQGNLDDWEAMIDTNVKGLLYVIRAITPRMAERKNGHIINVSSIAGTEVYPGGNVYCASKAAVSSLTRSMRLDLHKHNIRVSQVAPGHVEETEFARVRFDGDVDKATKVYENFQPLRSSDVAETIYFIATRPAHVNIQDIYMFGTQQASATMINRSGR
ncbi:MAG: SDR family NAD(P)-dependent oxidoreductase [Bacteroidota bacterium]